MTITTAELRRAIDLLLSEFEANGASEWFRQDWSGWPASFGSPDNRGWSP